MTERRLDPRTDPQYSLRNLLRIRARRQRYDLAVITTPDGILMAGSDEGRAAQRAAAEGARLVRDQVANARCGARTGAEMRALRFDSRGRELCLAVIRTQAGAERGDSAALEDLAGRVQQILSEAEQLAGQRQVARRSA